MVFLWLDRTLKVLPICMYVGIIAYACIYILSIDCRHITKGPAAVVISVSCTVLSFYIDLYSPSRQHKDRTGQTLYNTLQYSEQNSVIPFK